jgi:hypothetical protein
VAISIPTTKRHCDVMLRDVRFIPTSRAFSKNTRACAQSRALRDAFQTKKVKVY